MTKYKVTIEYVVDTETKLIQVAAKFLHEGVSAKDIREFNKLKSDDLEKGQVLYIPVVY